MNRWRTLDFFARDARDIEALAPLWRDLPETLRGVFVVPSKMKEHARSLNIQAESMAVLSRKNAVVVREHDLRYALHRCQRPTFTLDTTVLEVKKNDAILGVIPATVQGIEEFIQSQLPPPLRRVEAIRGETIGIVYMCWGAKAAGKIEQSIHSLEVVGLDIPLCVVGDTRVPGAQFIPWTGQSPFNSSERRNFQFRAGRVKPFLYDLTPFDRTLYIDADTEFVGDILPGFECLDDHDMALTEEKLTLGQLYNKKLAGWEINLIERDATIREVGDAHRKFINSGVIFFRKSQKVKETFDEWGRQWLRYQQWDEQLALVRAVHLCKPKAKYLDIGWNAPHREWAQQIFHFYGRGVARINVG